MVNQFVSMKIRKFLRKQLTNAHVYYASLFPFVIFMHYASTDNSDFFAIVSYEQ